MKCRIANDELEEVFSLGELHVSDFIEKNQGPRADKEEMKLLISKESGLLQMEKIVNPEFMYGKYWYRSGTNATMKRELQDVVGSVVDSVPHNDGDIFLDIACNDGTLFKFVPKSFTTIGIDPCDDTYANESRKHADHIVQDYFSAEAYWRVASKKAKFITTIAMFYDLDDPISFLNDIDEVLDDEGIFVLQLSYTPLMLKQLAFDNICHEHVCFYSLSSMKYLLDKVGFTIVDCILNDVNGGSFRIYIRKKSATKELFKTTPYRDVADFRINSMLEYEKKLNLNDPKIYKDFYNEIKKLREQTVSFIKEEKSKGKTIWGYGASTKGNTLLQWYGLDSTLIDAIAERNPVKFGLRTVGTNIPICSEEEMRAAKPDYLLILPWHFIYEFRMREKSCLEEGSKFIVPCPKFEIIGDLK
jgi:hypothetical protein|tara:strand:- start:8214 stop:9461 length:1248 start_codon:yes stop_codon:yes gene_type:complete